MNKSSSDQSPFTPDIGGIIPSSTAGQWIDKYEFAENISGTGESLTKSHFFGKNKIQELLDLPGTVGIRIYYALNDKGHKQLLLTAVDEDGKDIKTDDDKEEVVFYDMSRTCPPYCPW